MITDRSASWEALKTVNVVCPGRKIHAVGYCLGGTTLAITAAALARDGDECLADGQLVSGGDRLQ